MSAFLAQVQPVTSIRAPSWERWIDPLQGVTPSVGQTAATSFHVT